MRLRTVTAAALAAVLFAGTVGTGPAQAAAVRTMDYLDLPSGVRTVDVEAINNNGTIVGAVNNRAVKWNAATGAMTYLASVSGYPVSWAKGINNAGAIVGAVSTSTSDDYHRPVRWNTNGTVTFLVPISGSVTATTAGVATDIGEDGKIAGVRGPVDGPPANAARFTAGTSELLLPDGPNGSRVTGIATGGSAVGFTEDWACNCVARGFRYDPTPAVGNRVTWLTTETQESFPQAMSADGNTIAGTIDGEAVVWRPFYLPSLGIWLWLDDVLGKAANRNTYTNGMNNAGTMLDGETGGTRQAWFWQNDTFTLLPGANAVAVDANDSGVIVGFQRGTGAYDPPVIWR